MMKILVIEDNAQHLADAKAFFSAHPEVQVVYARTYVEAGRYVDFWAGEAEQAGKVDGIISDIYFPLLRNNPTWAQEEPIGVAVMVLCRECGIPCVLNTAGYHHGSRYEWITQLVRTLRPRAPEIVDASSDYFAEAGKKNWEQAFSQLQEVIAGTHGQAKPGEEL